MNKPAKPKKEKKRGLHQMLEEAKQYTNKEGRVIKIMPEELCKELRQRYRMVGIEIGNKCPLIGTRAWWFVIFNRKRQKPIVDKWQEQLRKYKASKLSSS